MGLFDELSTERKIMVLAQTKEGLIAEIIPVLLRNGLDPSDLDTTNPSAITGGLEPYEEARISKLCEGLEITKAKLDELGS